VNTLEARNTETAVSVFSVNAQTLVLTRLGGAIVYVCFAVFTDKPKGALADVSVDLVGADTAV
jgi:hypothetical protein